MRSVIFLKIYLLGGFLFAKKFLKGTMFSTAKMTLRADTVKSKKIFQKKRHKNEKK